MTSAQRLATAIVRGWTRTYTWRLPPSVRDTRRAEIESDLWEFEHDSAYTRGPAALHMLARVALGMPDDMSWRVANAPAASRPVRIIVLTTAMALTLAAFWVYEAARPQPLPLPPGRMAFVAAPPPPPPAPPPRPQLAPGQTHPPGVKTLRERTPTP